MSNIDMDDINPSNVKRSWRTLIEFPTDKVACAIFVQETVSCMIKQKLVRTHEEIDEAMVKLYEMLKCGDETESVKGERRSTPGDCSSDKDSVRSTCGTVAHLENFDDEPGGAYPYDISDGNDKCCQAPGRYMNTVQIGRAQLQSPVDFIFSSRSLDLMNDNFALERPNPQGLHIRLADVHENLYENNFDIYNGDICDRAIPLRNYILVVEEKESFDKDVPVQTKKRSRRSKKNKNLDKRCAVNATTNDSTLADHPANDKSHDLNRGVALPLHHAQEAASLNTYQSVVLNRNPVFLQKQTVTMSFSLFSWISSVYYLFVSVVRLTKYAYHKII